MPTISTPKKLKQSRTQCTVVFAHEETKAAEEKAVEKLGESIRIEGFRPGRAPAEMLRQKIDKGMLNEETVRMLLPAVFEAILKEHKLQPIIPPRVDMTVLEPLTLTLTFVEKPEVKVKGAGKISVPKHEKPVEKADVTRMMEYLKTQYRTTKPVDRVSQEGDELIVDFFGMADGKEVEGTRATGFRLGLGSKALIPGFEEQLTGLKKGDQKTFSVTFPVEYHAEHLRGKPVDFSVTVHEIHGVETPEFTDAFVKEHQLAESVKELEDRIEKTLREQEAQAANTRREKELFDAIRAATVIDLAPELVTHEERMIFDEIARNLERDNMQLSDWLKQTNRTPETMQKELQEEASKRLTLRFAIQWLMEEEKIEASPQEVAALRDQMMATVPEKERSKAEAYYKEGSEGYEELKWRRRVEKLVEGMLAR
jgi:trigger factor